MLLKDCEVEFETKDLYEVLNVKKDCSEAELKKGYYKQSMKWHPDRLSHADKEHQEKAKRKFQTVSGVYTLLSHKDKRAIYDETGAVDDDDGSDFATFEKLWRRMFKKVSPEDIDNYMKDYQGSDIERCDLKINYKRHKGDFDMILESTIGETWSEDEPRFKEIIEEMFASGELKETKKYKQTTTKAATAKREKQAKKEAKEAEEALKELQVQVAEPSGGLEAMILANQKKRKDGMDSFFDQLAAKYADPPTKKKSKKGK
ncbi:unnamed protein product, partial [Mesorhabditis belari]|uniref:J domain-containing protein n=1 Tax=Mesorhabditis belari TaxID=2138241 RepID=A0AAF3FH50_9BILA